MKHEILWLVGGICVALGFVACLSGGFGVPGGDIALMFPNLGYDGVDDLRVNGGGMLGLVLIVSGLACLVGANSTAWKKTNGY